MTTTPSGTNNDPLNDLPFDADDATLGAWFHRHLTARFAVETEAWATDQVGRVMARLNAVRARCPVRGACPFSLQAELLWIGERTAFALPGSYIYIARELLQEFPGDEPVAFVLAHEAAHHDLGHVRRVAPTLKMLKNVPGGVVAGLLVEACSLPFRAPAFEDAADEYAAHLTVAMGYNARKCVALFESFERHLLDHRDLDGVFGSDTSGEGIAGQFQRTVARWSRPHASIHERRARFENLLRREYGL
ncbi:MAG: M48 family metalloprotease [Akkermansiaceae bacterium]|nr:M48 family metalloprotease [Armatimonadota bacterium]